MKEIPLTKGKIALVDDEDFKWLSQWKWYAHSSPGETGEYYAARRDKRCKEFPRGKFIYMHRLIVNAKDGEEVDHINRQKHFNSKENLRKCLHSENCHNTGKKNVNTTGFIGVTLQSGYTNKWFARVNKIHLGTYNNIVEAAQRYDAAAVYLFGEFAVLNFPEHKEDYLKQIKELN